MDRARFFARPLARLALAASLLIAAVATAAPQMIGMAAVVVNDVRIKPGGTAQFRRAALRQRVALADQVQTGADSRLQLLLLDRTRFTLGANARLTIDRFVYDPNGGSLSAEVAKGAFRFVSGRGSARKETTVRSPAAVIGVRGTILDGVVGEQAVAIARGERAVPRDVASDPQTATLAVLRGPGPAAEGKLRIGAVDVTGAGRTVTLDRPLLAAYVPRAGAEPIGPFTLSLPGVAWLNGLILTPPERLPVTGAQPLPFPGREPREWPGYRSGYPGPYPDQGPQPGYSIPALPSLPPGNANPGTQRPRATPGATPAPSPSPVPTGGASGSPNRPIP